MNTAQELLNLKTKITDSTVKLNKLQGQKEEAVKTLKKEFKVKTIKEARKLLKEMQKEVKKDSKVFEKQVEKLGRRIENGVVITNENMLGGREK